jgi:hypothetical protein
MADKGTWVLSTNVGISGKEQSSQIIHLNLGPALGPFVLYRIHNDGPLDVFALLATEAPTPPGGGAINQVAIEPGTDCDISGSALEFGMGIQLRLDFASLIRGEIGSASGTYELLCCQPPQQPTRTF